MAFLSLLDDRAKPKGSRDPLGFELVWTRFGRTIIGNLTTITSSLENFAVAQLGFYWANKINQHINEKDRHKAIRETFLRYEQVAGYLRYLGESREIMGITRVKERMMNDSYPLSLGLTQKQVILSDQASYGLWGFYSSASRDSGLVLGNDRKPLADCDAVSLMILKKMPNIADAFYDLIKGDHKLDRDTLSQWSQDYMSAINHPDVREKLMIHLMGGSKTSKLQHELWTITKTIFEKENSTPETVPVYVNTLLDNKPSEALVDALKKIQTIERVLVTINNLFHYCRRKDGVSLDDILSTLEDHYQYHFLPEKLPVDDFPWKTEINEILIALQQNNNKSAIQSIFSLNKKVMMQRNGAPWIELEPNKVLRVKMKSEKATLKSQEKLESAWDYGYFMESFLAISSKQLGAKNG